MRASAAMTRNVVCIDPNDSISDAHQVMTEWEIRHLPVLHNGRLVGILSDRDVLLRSRATEEGLDIDDVPVEDAMTPHPITCMPATSIAEIGRAMTSHKIDSVPVVDEDGELVGLVTSTDLLELLCAKEESLAARTIPYSFAVHASVRPRATAKM